VCPQVIPDPQDETTIHDGPRFTVKSGRFGDKEREWVEAPHAVGVVAYDDENVYLVRQPREAIGRDDVLEIPAGLMDVEGESPLETGKRELQEEIGYEADTWEHATTVFSSSGFTDEQVHIYLATGLRRTGEPDESGEEDIDLVTWPLDQLDGAIDGAADAKTLIGLLWLRRAQLLG
jgi:8-oxo-dGTP pyrophosphatase MutT (NUDIX family)